MVGNEAKHFTVRLTDRCVTGITKAGGTHRHLCERALQVRQRP